MPAIPTSPPDKTGSGLYNFLAVTCEVAPWLILDYTHCIQEITVVGGGKAFYFKKVLCNK